MNASKCCYTIFSSAGRSDMELDLRLKGDQIPYNPNPVFLGITFDESLCFNKHFANLRVRALKRLNILKILERYKIYSIFFIPYEFINRKRKKNIIEENIITNKNFNIISDVKKDNQNKYKSLSMTFSDLKKIIKKGHSIGCHGYNHIRLSDELDNLQLKKEIINLLNWFGGWHASIIG